MNNSASSNDHVDIDIPHKTPEEDDYMVKNEYPCNFHMAESTIGVSVVGSRISVYYLSEHQYFDGTVYCRNNGKLFVINDDNDIGTLNLETENWQYIEIDTSIASQSGFSTVLKTQ